MVFSRSEGFGAESETQNYGWELMCVVSWVIIMRIMRKLKSKKGFKG